MEQRWLTDYWYERFKESEIYFKVNGFRHSTFIEQSIIDLGRSATEWMYKYIIKEGLPVYSLRSVAKDEVVAALKAMINPAKFFETRELETYISPSHRIHIDLMGSYIPRARRLVRAHKNGNVYDNEPDIRCLKTYDDAKTKCYSKCASDEPLKVYKDVELIDGALSGEFTELNGCSRCSTQEEKNKRLFRPTPQSKNSYWNNKWLEHLVMGISINRGQSNSREL